MKKHIMEKGYDEIAKELSKLKEEYSDLEIKAVRCFNGKYKFILSDSEKQLKLVGINRKNPHFKDLYKLADYKVNHFKIIPTAISLTTAAFVLLTPSMRPYVAEAKENFEESPQIVSDFIQDTKINIENENNNYNIKQNAQIMVAFMQMEKLAQKLEFEASSIYVNELQELVDQFSQYDLSPSQQLKLSKYQVIIETYGKKIITDEEKLINFSQRI